MGTGWNTYFNFVHNRLCLHLASKQKFMDRVIDRFLLLDNCLLFYGKKEPAVLENNESFVYNKFHAEYTACFLIPWIRSNVTLAKGVHVDEHSHFQLMH